MTVTRCRLCGAAAPRGFADAHGRRFLRCGRCLLTFCRPVDLPPPDAERAHYDLHENDPDDPAYRAFLSRLVDPLLDRLPARSEGLDYGSGPGPTLSRMLEEAGHPMVIHDPFYAPDTAALDREYDFVTATEVIEHFHQPGAEFDRLRALLRPAGVLGVMTEILTDDARFPDWWYVRDPTHVAFYREETLAWIADRHHWTLERPSRTVALFRDIRRRTGGGRRGETARGFSRHGDGAAP